MRGKAIVGVMIGFVIMGGVSCETISTSDEFNKVLETVNLNNEGFRVPKEKEESFINKISKEELIESKEVIGLSQNKDKGVSNISKDKAIEDVEFLFTLLRNNYGLYTYLGGDLKFLKAKENIVEEIKGNISKEDFYNLLVENLSFINDNHFTFNIDGRNLDTLGKKSYFYSLKEDYYKDKKGFFINEGNDKKYIVSINNDNNIEKYMKLSIGKAGELVYKIGEFIPFNEDTENKLEKTYFDINVSYKIKDNLIDEKKTLFKADYLKDKNEEFSLKIQDGIPILSLGSFSLNEEKREEFLKSAFELEKYKINILDLRGNGGGDGTLVVEWLENRFGFRPVGNSKKIGLNRFLTEEGKVLEKKDFLGKDELFNLEFKEDYYYSKDIDEEKLYKNDSLIFILTDVNEGSATEMFIEYLKNYENVVLVGTNTSGTMQGSNYGIDFKLPNSEIHFAFGQWLYLYDDRYFKESVGYKPDLWTNGDEALTKTLELIEHYKLKTKIFIQ